MQATVKCSNCGAEITNLSFTWGKKHWLWMMPLIILLPLLSMIPMWQIFKGKGDFRKDLQITVLETRKDEGKIDILGTVQNSGKTAWENIQLTVDFFDAQGKFLDQESGRVTNSVGPGDTEHFKISILSPSDRIKPKDVRMEVKAGDAFSRMF
jgi:hypothetical protein